MIQLTAVLSRSPNLQNKFLEYLSFIDKSLQDQRVEDVLTLPAVDRVLQSQLLQEVKELHLEGSERRYIEAIRSLEARIED